MLKCQTVLHKRYTDRISFPISYLAVGVLPEWLKYYEVKPQYKNVKYMQIQNQINFITNRFC
jgi:hypothetical protein